ncbi:Metallo-dependent phosphatase-like protein [Chaetomium fimeti]|uniref:Metallo-dependent phosphatase-like protein n=1 Tax=Chaetomium fimeti TaxID=1854472 RepID=A0AAE0LNE9_9PEZI|nr:Metallo-dependent phosphatase-like protein [Chaetomium fimeti]
MVQDIKTRFFILADTHAKEWCPPNLPVDVAIHCGDLTDGSKMEEFRASLALLRGVNAPLKLVIAGNHDFTLDTLAYQKKATEANRLFSIDPEVMAREYGGYGDARKLLDDDDGVILLDEGTHHFDLSNGARLTVYASPFTPSAEADWGFQYRHREDHDYAITTDVDIVITHGPPKGVLDQTTSKQRGGCAQLFAAVARARPRLHCFGHIHEGWGAKVVAWRDTPSENPSHFTDIDNDASVVVETLATMRPGKWDDAETVREKEALAGRLATQGYRQTSHCAGDDHPTTPGKATLFVNAAVQPRFEEDGPQPPWVVDIDLPPTIV